MNKKYLLIFSLVVIVSAITYTFLSARNQNKTLVESLPLIPQKTNLPSLPVVTPGKIIPIPATKIEDVSKDLDADQSLTEIEKITSQLPLYIKDFPTSTGIKTTINVYISQNDSGSMLRIEIFGPNYNNPDPKGKDALAFKESFLNIKNTFNLYKVNLKKIQIVYGNRQYIQSTASSWVKTFSLLN